MKTDSHKYLSEYLFHCINCGTLFYASQFDAAMILWKSSTFNAVNRWHPVTVLNAETEYTVPRKECSEKISRLCALSRVWNTN